MANPRKFSEKIAQHKQKQAEETAEFERIMREVSDVTNKPEEITLGAQYGGGSRAGGCSPSPASRAPVQRGRAASSVGPMRARPAERKHDTSPYGSSVYLSPPADSSWRRTNSDSALHQSCGEPAPPPSALSPHLYTQHPHHAHRRNMDSSNLMAMLGAAQTRPRSSCDIPRVPGINIYESRGNCGTLGPGGGGGGGGMLGGVDSQMPGGSLPDLTSFHSDGYPMLPHRTPPDYHRRSPYHQSPRSPDALSPAGAGGGLSPVGGGLSPVGSGLSPVGGGLSPVGGGAGQGVHPAYDTQNHLSVPNSNSYLHRNTQQSISPLEQSWISAGYQTAHCSPPSLHSSHSNVNIPSPTMGGHSPGSPAPESPQTDYYIGQAALLQPFQQISMVDTPVTNYNTGYMNHSSPTSQSNSHHTYSQSGANESDRLSGERDTRTERDPVAGGNAPLFPPVTSPSAPASIPDIIFTDFSADLGMSKDMESGLFECEEERLREGLDPVDLDGLTLLSDPASLLSDPSAEDVFRLDRL